MGKQILFNEDAKKALRTGVNKVADAVGSTMGADGKTVIISNHFSLPPINTKDGVSVASSIILDDEIENIGAQLIRKASETTMRNAGDGTTQTAVLAQSIINEGLKQVAKGANPQEVKTGIDIAVKEIIGNLQRMSEKIGDDNNKIRNIATISANNDMFIGGLIGDAYKQIGKDGLLLIENSGTIETKIEIVDGYEMPRGYISPDFSNDEKKRAVHNNAMILVADYTIKSMKEIFPILQQMDQAKLLQAHPLIIVAQDFEGEVYSSLLINHRQKQLQCCLVKAPSTYRKEHLQDIATMTGATLIRDEDGLKVEGALLKHLGSADKIMITEYTTTVIGGGGKKEKIDDLRELVKVQIESISDEQLKAIWERRLAKIAGCIAVIKVGGATDIEQKEKVDRVDDACRAVKSAIEEGVVVGGGVALLRASSTMVDKGKGDIKVGLKIIKNACRAPLAKMLDNAGVELIKKSWWDRFLMAVGLKQSVLDFVIGLEGDMGFNVKTKEFENLRDSGVIDPVKVIRCALQNAASVAGAVITSDCLVVEVPKKV